MYSLAILGTFCMQNYKNRPKSLLQNRQASDESLTPPSSDNKFLKYLSVLHPRIPLVHRPKRHFRFALGECVNSDAYRHMTNTLLVSR